MDFLLGFEHIRKGKPILLILIHNRIRIDYYHKAILHYIEFVIVRLKLVFLNFHLHKFQ